MNHLFKLTLFVLFTLTLNLNGLNAQDRDDDEALQKMAEAVLTFREEAERGLDMMRDVHEEFGDDQRVSLTLVQSLQQVAQEKLQENRKLANPYFFESGEIARSIKITEDSPPFAGAVIATAIYNEACSYGIEENEKKAIKYLKLAFEKGFDNYDLAATDADFGDLLETEEYKQIIADAKTAGAKREVNAVKTELADFETFDFELDTVDMHGKDVTLADMEGKVVMIHLWSTKNRVARQEIPNLIGLQKKYSGDVQVFGVAFETGDDEDEAHEAVVEYMEANNMNYQSALGDDDFREQIPNLEQFPATLFIDAEGAVRYCNLGPVSAEKSEAIIKQLLAENE